MAVQVSFSAILTRLFVKDSLFLWSKKMPAVFINCGAIILGSLIGLLFSKKIPEKVTDAISLACGGVTLVMGVQMALKYQNVVYLALAVILGGIVGTLLDIDGAVLKVGKWLAKVFKQDEETLNVKKAEEINGAQPGFSSGKPKKNFAYGFLNASVLFCVGAMTIVGSFKAGIEKDYSIILLKSILDGFISIGMAVTLGVGTAFSALSVFVYQGLLTLLSVWIAPFVTETLLNEITGSGGVLIVFIGLNIMAIKKIKTADYLPSVFFTVLFVLMEPVVKGLF